MRRFWLPVLLCLAGGPAWTQEATPHTPTPQPSFRHLDGSPIVILADGSGATTATYDCLHAASQALQVPLPVLSVPWCRHAAAPQDHTDYAAHCLGAARMTALVLAVRRDCPHSPLILIGYSTGCRVALLAAESLPPGSVERIVLLAASVSCSYDLTPALKATSRGIDSFWSAEDGVLEYIPGRLGTADGLVMACAGQVGFQAPGPPRPEQVELYRKLRQYRWHEAMGGQGGHSTWHAPRFQRRYLVPLLMRPVP